MTPNRIDKKEKWWKPSHRTVVTVLAAVSAIALLAGFIFGGRDSSGDAAGQGLASAFEAAFFAFGVSLIALVALVAWLSQHLRPFTIIMVVAGIALLLVVTLFV